MKLVPLRRDETAMLPAESVIRRWASEEAGSEWTLPHREAVIVAAWFLGVILFLVQELMLFNGGYAQGQRDAFQTCSSWRLK